MSLKLKPLVIALVGLAGTQVYAASPSNAQLEQQIQQITARTQQLQSQVTTLKGKVATLKTRLHSAQMGKAQKMMLDKSTEEAVHAYSFVRLGSYLNQQFKYDGSQLVVNAPDILESQALLADRAKSDALAKKNGYPTQSWPYLVLSGELEGQINYTKPSGASHNSDIDLTDAELDSQIVMSKWVTGFMSLAYDNYNYSNASGNTSNVNRTNNSRVQLDQGFISFGNFTYSPYYATVGQMYLPFGRYSSSMVKHVMARDLARVKARALSVGYHQAAATGFSGSAYAFKADVGTGSQRNNFNNFGLDADYKYAVGQVTGDAGVGYISNIADAQGMQDIGRTSGFKGFGFTGSDKLRDAVGGYDVHAKASVGQFGAIAEFVSASRSFNKADMSFNGRAAKPKAMQLEGNFSFDAWGVPSSFALGFGQTYQALGLDLPQRRYAATVNFNVWRETMLSFEFRRDQMYKSTDLGGPQGSNAFNGEGGYNNVVTAQMDMYF